MGPEVTLDRTLYCNDYKLWDLPLGGITMSVDVAMPMSLFSFVKLQCQTNTNVWTVDQDSSTRKLRTIGRGRFENSIILASGNDFLKWELPRAPGHGADGYFESFGTVSKRAVLMCAKGFD